MGNFIEKDVIIMVEHILANLKIFVHEMQVNEKVISGYLFSFKQVGYTVLVNRDPKREYYLALLHFQNNQTNQSIEAFANSTNIAWNPLTDFFKFFSINDNKHSPHNVLQNFARALNAQTPNVLPTMIDKDLNDSINQYFNQCDPENPNKKYCYQAYRNGVKNGEQQHRTIFNAQKTQNLRPELFKKLKADKEISFRYSSLASREKSDSDIITNFVQKDNSF